MKKDVIIALDFPTVEETMDFLDKFDGQEIYAKIGMELFYSQGPKIVKEIKKRGHKVFLDLKLHDIPNTVKSSMKVLGGLGVDMTNLHCSGSKEMMKAALEGLKEGSKDGSMPILIGVTMLTSTTQEVMKNEILIDKNLEDVVLSYGSLAKESGLMGVVCSPLESPIIHENLGKEFLTITPGIRFEDDSKGDQKRVTTPKMAKELGSDFIVVGRSITKAKDPVSAYNRCVKEFV